VYANYSFGKPANLSKSRSSSTAGHNSAAGNSNRHHRNERKTSGRNRQNPGPETKSATGNHLQAPDLYTEKKTVTLRSKYQRSFINHGFIAVLAKRLAALRPDAING